MPQHSEDYKRLLAQKHFLEEIEQGIEMANQEIIHASIASLGRERFLKFAVTVAKLRAQYLLAAFQLFVGESEPDPAGVAKLREKREMFEEALSAFEALRRAIEKGYVGVVERTATKSKAKRV